MGSRIDVKVVQGERLESLIGAAALRPGVPNPAGWSSGRLPRASSLLTGSQQQPKASARHAPQSLRLNQPGEDTIF